MKGCALSFAPLTPYIFPRPCGRERGQTFYTGGVAPSPLEPPLDTQTDGSRYYSNRPHLPSAAM